MHIAIQARFLGRPFSGIGAVTYGILEALGKIDHKNTYTIFTPGKPAAPLNLPQNFSIRVLPELCSMTPWQKPFAGFRKTFWEQYQVPRAARKVGADFLHLFYPTPLHTKLPMIITVHDCIPWKDPRYKKGILSHLYQRAAEQAVHHATHLIAVSEATKQDFVQRGIPQKKITVIANGPDRWLTKSMPQTPHTKTPYILYFGGFDPRKNVERLIRIFQTKIAPFHKINLVIAGGRTHGTKLDAQYAQFGLSKLSNKDTIQEDQQATVLCTGAIESDQLLKLLHGALAFVHLSEEEGFNIPLLDAALMQKVIVASDIPAHRELLKNSPEARFVHPHRDNEIAQALTDAVTGKIQPVTPPEGYTWHRAAEQLLTLYTHEYSLLDHSHR